jgi:DNA topoisomerase IB
MFAALQLAKRPRPDTAAERKKAIVDCVQAVADELGNTPAIARASYIDPYIFKEFEKGDRIAKTLKMASRLRRVQYLSKNEQIVIKLLSARS